MKYFNSQKKRILLGLLLAVVVFVGVAAPVNRALAVLGVDTGIAAGFQDFFFVEVPSMLANMMLTVTSWFLGVAGLLLNTVIQYTVIDMAAHIRGVDGINTAWKVFRDLANLGFVFILLDVAIKTILGVGNVNTKKVLVNVIIIALLLNFSLFFTKVIIDGSNILTLGFYNKISVAGSNGASAWGGVSGAFMNKLGVSGLFDVNGTANLVKGFGPANAPKIILFGIFGGMLFLITAFVFMAAALMFIVRYVTLIFLMILSPLAFAAMALPHDSYSGKWWDRLMKNVIFAPIFMVLVWATLTVLEGILSSEGTNGINSMVKAINEPILSVGLIMNFIIVIIMMIATLVIANELGDRGTSGAINYAKKLRGKTTSWVGRNTLGRAGANLDKKFAQSTALGGFADSRVGRFARSYTTGALAESKFGGEVSRKADAERIKKEKTDIANNRRINNLKDTIKSTKVPENLTLREIAGIHPTKRAAARADRLTEQEGSRNTLEKTYQSMSNKELELLDAKTLAEHAQYLSPSQIEHVLEKSDKFNEQEKETIKNARFEPLKAAIASGNAAEAKKLTKPLSDKEIEILGSEITNDPKFTEEFIKNLSQSQIDNIMKSQKFTPTQKKKIKDAVIKPLQTAVAGGVVADIGTILKNMKPPQIAKLDPVMLFDNNVFSQLTPAMMGEMPKELSPDTLKQIGDKIRATVAGGGTHAASEYIKSDRVKHLFQ